MQMESQCVLIGERLAKIFFRQYLSTRRIVLPPTTSNCSACLFLGPLPPAEELAKYNNAVPDAAERILKMAEIQANHRQALETRVVRSEMRRAWGGLFCGLIVSVLALSASTYVIMNGHDAAGSLLFGSSLASIVIAFIKGTESRRKEREEKMRIQTGG